jgi:hypothetical protein
MYIHLSIGRVTKIEITLRIPDDLAGRLGTAGEVEQRALEALALEEYKLGHLTKPELRRLLSFATGEALDEFLRAHDALGLEKGVRIPREPTEPPSEETRRAKARQAVANIIARGKGDDQYRDSRDDLPLLLNDSTGEVVSPPARR